jgi:uncharacterized protein (DUF58 family)
MLPREVLSQIRRLHLRARHAVEDLLGGEYHSVFKGTGLSFEEVRAYQPGDEIRSIDWNVTARMGQPFIKRYIEERELTVMLLIDQSGSQHFGTHQEWKRDVTAELAAVLAFSAVSNNDKVGLTAFSDIIERFVPPRKGTKHALRIIRDILFLQPQRRRTSLRTALDYVGRLLRRRSIVFLLSDFLDSDFAASLKRTASKHDLIAIQVVDPIEEKLPDVGLLEVEDVESGLRRVLDTGSLEVRQAYAYQAASRQKALEQLLHASGADLVRVSTRGGHLDALIRFFRMREQRLRRTRG